MNTVVGKLSFGLVVMLLLCLVSALPASADTLAYSVPLQAGNQNYMGSLGMDFDVNQAILLTGIGVFDPNAVTGTPLTGPLSVAIYDRDTQRQVAGSLKTFAAGTVGPLTGANLIADITPFIFLDQGHYSVVAWGYNRSQLNGNSGAGPVTSVEDDGGGLISFVGVSRFGDSDAYPTHLDSGPTNRYLAGTFTYTSVPEPATLTLILPVLVGLTRKIRRS